MVGNDLRSIGMRLGLRSVSIADQGDFIAQTCDVQTKR